MLKDRLSDLQIICQRTCKYFVMICWFLGLLIGVEIAAGADSSTFLWMLSDRFTVSISGLLSVVALPFLLTAIAVLFSNRSLLLTVVFFKAVCFGYLGYGITSLFGGASWLVQFFLLFSDVFITPLLMLCWIRCADARETVFKSEFLFCFAVSLAVWGMDILFISPFSASIL